MGLCSPFTSALHVIGIYFFTKGFLLTRLVLDHKSECAKLPPSVQIETNHDTSTGCWHPKKFDKAVILIIDALRYDFTIPFEPRQANEAPHYYHDSIPILHDIAVKHPSNAFLLPFIADPPTTTLQRLKGLTTGTLPTFIDAGSNFAGTAIEEDNLIDQLKENGRRIVHLGDDTWHALFPHQFVPNLTHAYDSFNVWDLHTVDNGVMEHMMPLLQPENSAQWDVLIGHCLGVDHAGHRYGPDHPAMKAKLLEMDSFINRIVSVLDEDTLLVVMGDHGMDTKGDHGGESDDEVEAALWMYSKRPAFGRSLPEYTHPPANAKVHPVAQIDLVPTLAFLLGLPIPFNNLGMPIEEAFIGPKSDDWANIATVSRLTSAQINSYQKEYEKAKSEDTPNEITNLWIAAEKSFPQTSKARTHTSYRDSYGAYREYQKTTLARCRSLWANFSPLDMLAGISLLAASLIFFVIFARGIRSDTTAIKLSVLRRGILGAFIGFAIGSCISLIVRTEAFSYTSLTLFAASSGSVISAILEFASVRARLVWLLPSSIWGWMSLVFTISQSIGFASNSFTIWEDEISLYFLITFGLVSAISSLRQQYGQDRILGIYHSILFLVMTRMASLSRLCREEQMPYCRSSFYASSASSTSAPWQLLLSLICAMMLPSIVKAFYQGTLSYEGSAIHWIGTIFRMTLLIVTCYWALDAIDNAGWFPFILSYLMKPSDIVTVKIMLAQIVIGIALVVGAVTFFWAKPCINIAIKDDKNGDPSLSGPDTPLDILTSSDSSKPTITILGYANVFGTHYLILLTAFFLPLFLLSPPMGQLSLSLLLFSILSLLEILDTNGLTPSSSVSTSPLSRPYLSSIGPTILALLGSFHFFKTGHTATLSSIQWNTAFIPLRTITYPWSPTLVTLNTFSAQILCALAVPLLVLWKRSANHGKSARYPNGSSWSRALLTDISAAVAGYLCYYATVNLATTMWAGHLRRHLMVYRVFGPRFMMGAAVLAVVELVAIVIAIGGTRWTLLAVGDVFGY